MTEQDAVQQSTNGVVEGDAAVAAISPDKVAEVQTDWYWSNQEGAQIKGLGTKPEWLLPKYKTAEEQAKAYPEVAKKLGSFTGAPENYDVKKYSEDKLFNKEAAKFVEFTKMAKDMGLNQEGFEKMFDFYSKDRSDIIENLSYTPEKEMAKLGEQATHRLDTVDRYLKATLDKDAYEAAAAKVTTHEAVELVEMLIAASAPKKLPSQGGVSPSGMDESKLRELRYAKAENGELRIQVDSDYRKYVEKLWEEHYGKNPGVQVIGWQ